MAEIESVASRIAEERPVARPYTPSWLNRLITAVAGLPVPAWAVYIALAAALALLEIGVKWRDGAYANGFYPFHLVLAVSPIYSIATGHLLFNQAGKALDRFRPVLAGGAEIYEDLRYRITTVPARPALLASIIGTGLGLLLLVAGPGEQWQPFKLATSPAAAAVDGLLLLAEWWTICAALYATVHILRLVHRIYTRHTHITLFRLGPLYTLSQLTAVVAFAWLIGSYSWVVTVPDIFNNSSWLVVVASESVLALVAFVWPLFGAHRLREAEKDRLAEQVAERLERVMAEVHRKTDAGAYETIPGLNAVIDSLSKEQARVDQYPTWPWQGDTVRLLVSAALLPIALWLAQRVLERLGF